jgi:hypothetical protein
MGQAKRRGSYEERKRAAMKRNKNLLLEHMGGRDERLMTVLRAGISPFLSRMSKGEWQARRRQIIEFLKAQPEPVPLEKAKAIRVRDDEIGWYLFLCEQTLEDPLCLDIAQSQRLLPFFVGIGERSIHSEKVKGLQRKISEALSTYKNSPDGTIFEILVALSYAAKGWDVEFLKEDPPNKSPDFTVRKNGTELFVECKRLQRRTEYAEQERTEFLRIWDAAVEVLIENKQWLWLKAIFHSELSTLPTNFLAQILQRSLPTSQNETILHDDVDAKVQARLIDRRAVNSHLDNYMVKEPSPMLSNLLGGDWAPENSATTVVHYSKHAHVEGCDAPVLGTYIVKIGWACGITRIFDSEISIDKKARDVTKLLSDAVKQVPQEKPSIIHIAAETLEGRGVELRRTEKVMASIPSFVMNKPVLAVRLHRFQSNSRTNLLYEFDETVENFQDDGALPYDIPWRVIVPDDVEEIHGRHWELYD